MKTRFPWKRDVTGTGRTVEGGAIVVLRDGDGRVYLHVQVDDDFYDGVIDPDELVELVRVVKLTGGRPA